ncbi:MAG: hypothetical protein IPM60_00890 [Rhodospirillales bacterium]|nr:hypothetical protein [Rhodospirillales bacterium]
MPFAFSLDNGDVVLTGTNGDDFLISEDPFEIDGDGPPINPTSIVTSGGVAIDVPLSPGQGLTINARGGDDTIEFDPAGTANDLQVSALINGGGGNDSIEGGRLGDTINGDNGNDFLDGNEGNDEVNGGNGRDTVEGGTGNDTLTGGNAADTLLGEGGNDDLSGNDGNDSLNGGAGRDVLNGGKNNDQLTGGGGIDTYEWGDGPDENKVSDFDGDFDRVNGFNFRELLDFTGIDDIDTITVIKLNNSAALLTIEDDNSNSFDVRVNTNTAGLNRLLQDPDSVIDADSGVTIDTPIVVVVI